jgi:hypothetical protein
MQRRSFLGICGAFGAVGAAAAPAAEPKRTRLYVLEQYYLKNGPQMDRIHESVSKTFLPALNRFFAGPKLYLQALVAPHMPQFVALYGFESFSEMWDVHTKMSSDAPLAREMEKWESGPEPPFEHMTASLLEAADYSPEIQPSAGEAAPRIFELRVYHSPSWRQLKALHERFAGPEIKIFHRVGVRPILYSSTLFGQNCPNLTYIIPFADLAAREKAWNAFGADPDWIKVRRESIEKHGQISSVIQISLYRATAYSPVR